MMTHMSQRHLFTLCAVTLGLVGCGEETPARRPAPAAKNPADESRAQRFAESRFFRSEDLFLAADRPRDVAAEDAKFLVPEDEVLGFALNGEARAYPVYMLCYHHVVNDVIADVPIAVAY